MAFGGGTRLSVGGVPYRVCRFVSVVGGGAVCLIDQSVDRNQSYKIPKIPKRNGMYVCIYAAVAAAAIIIVIVFVASMWGSNRTTKPIV